MIIGQECKLLSQADRTYSIAIGNIEGAVKNVIIDEDRKVDLLAVRHKKSRKVMVKITTTDDNFVIVDRRTMFQIKDMGKARIIEAANIKKGHIICSSTHEIEVKSNELIMCKASILVFDKCDYVTINHLPIVHDNYEDRGIRRMAKRSNLLASLLMNFKK